MPFYDNWRDYFRTSNLKRWHKSGWGQSSVDSASACTQLCQRGKVIFGPCWILQKIFQRFFKDISALMCTAVERSRVQVDRCMSRGIWDRTHKIQRQTLIGHKHSAVVDPNLGTSQGVQVKRARNKDLFRSTCLLMLFILWCCHFRGKENHRMPNWKRQSRSRIHNFFSARP